jgi:hypothetical protein
MSTSSPPQSGTKDKTYDLVVGRATRGSRAVT